MKAIFLLFILLAFVSCGGGGKSGTNNQPHSEKLTFDCLEGKLGWLASPPESVEEAVREMNATDFEKCENLEQYAMQINFKGN